MFIIFIVSMQKIYEGKTKIVYTTSEPDKVLIKFKDSITALDGKKCDTLPGKGKINASISAKLFELLKRHGVDNHYIKFVEPDALLVKRLDMLKLEVVCRNYAAGHFASRFPMIKEGAKLKRSVIEFYYKSDELGDPLLADDHVVALEIANEEEIQYMKRTTRKVNEILQNFFEERGLRLVDFKVEYGRLKDGNLLLGDELNADCMRLRGIKDDKIYDKDVYRKGGSLSDVLNTYKALYDLVSS